jgi:hypothetical protein
LYEAGAGGTKPDLIARWTTAPAPEENRRGIFAARRALAQRAREPRIAIVGAGPAGLAAAWYLKQRGYRDVLVLEKLGRVGGLCKSITDGYASFDLGGNYITPAYRETRKLASTVHAPTYRAKKYRVARVVGSGEEKHLEFAKVATHVRFEAARAGEPEAAPTPIPLWKMAKGVLKFAWLRFRVRRWVDHPTFAAIHEREDLCVPFDAWLDSNGIGFLKRMFEIPLPMMGYGLLDEVIAAYVLKYMAPGTYWSMILRGVGGLTRWPRRFVYGFQRMWQEIANGLNVRTDVTIEKIRRRVGEELPIEITLSYPDQIFNSEQESRLTLRFDRLILTCPFSLDVLRDQLHLDLEPEESELIGQIETYSYCQTTLHAVKVVDGKEEPLKLPAPVVPILPFARETIGYPWVVVQVWGDKSRLLQLYSRIDPQAAHWPRVGGFASHELLSSALGTEDASRKVVIDRAERVVGWLGGEVAGSTDPRLRRWRTFDRWPYFGHVSAEGFRKGFFSRLEALQGRFGTYYAGGVTTFELIESVVRSAKHVVEKLDADLRREFRPPAP